MCRLLRISREDLIVNLDKSVFGFGHPDDIGRMAYFGKNFAAHTDEKYDVFSAGRHDGGLPYFPLLGQPCAG
ncbi:hypothetical protein ACXO8N_06030 [Lactobacillus delbrueckii subsp. bulgaricus]